MMKKLFFSFLIFVSAVFYAAAVPGADHYMKDFPGEYVFYEDNSFSRKSYIGFLTYGEKDFAVRYFAPPAKELPAKNIEILFSLNPEKDYIDLTGELFVTPISQEDTEIVNYIHDLIYELGSRRKKAGQISPFVAADKSLNPKVTYVSGPMFMDTGFRSKEEFVQFGGEVFVYYDYYVPFFNIKKIESNSGEPLLTAIASGVLKSSDDKSFSNFQPVEAKVSKDLHSQKIKSPKVKPVSVEGTSISLDENWSAAEVADNIFFHGEAAMLAIHSIKKAESEMFIKSALLSSAETFVPWDKISIIQNEEKISVHSLNWGKDKTFAVTTSVLLKSDKFDENSAALMTLVVNEADWNANRKYYSKILTGWK